MNEAKKPARVLVVDDDARNLRLAVTALEQAGHEVLSAEGGAAGRVNSALRRSVRKREEQSS